SGITALSSGLGAWLTTLPGQHIIGASGVVFGVFGYLAVRTWFTDDVLRKIIYFVIGLFIFVTYGASMVFGMLPQTSDISWQGHRFGFAGGSVGAWLLHGRRPGAERQVRVPRGRTAAAPQRSARPEAAPPECRSA